MQEELKHDLKQDPLLSCLVIFTKLHNTPYSAEALTAGLPIEKGLKTIELFSLKQGSKSLFTRAAQHAGFASRLAKKELKDISPLVLPCILILKKQSACILLEINKETKKAKIIHPEVEGGESWVDLEVLEEEYLGFCFLLKKEFSAENATKSVLKNGDEHWFWGTIKRSKKIYFDVVIASLVVNVFVLASPLFTMNVYDRVIPNNAI
jgi:ATP-binding cassette subfamily C protein LapB